MKDIPRDPKGYTCLIDLETGRMALVKAIIPMPGDPDFDPRSIKDYVASDIREPEDWDKFAGIMADREASKQAYTEKFAGIMADREARRNANAYFLAEKIEQLARAESDAAHWMDRDIERLKRGASQNAYLAEKYPHAFTRTNSDLTPVKSLDSL